VWVLEESFVFLRENLKIFCNSSLQIHPPGVFTRGGKTPKNFHPMTLKGVFLVFFKKVFFKKTRVFFYTRVFNKKNTPSAM